MRSRVQAGAQPRHERALLRSARARPRPACALLRQPSPRARPRCPRRPEAPRALPLPHFHVVFTVAAVLDVFALHVLTASYTRQSGASRAPDVASSLMRPAPRACRIRFHAAARRARRSTVATKSHRVRAQRPQRLPVVLAVASSACHGALARGCAGSSLWYNPYVRDLSELLELPPAERLQLVEALWDSLLEIPEAVPISDDVREELDRRLAAYYADPSSARPWDEIKAELLGTK